MSDILGVIPDLDELIAAKRRRFPRYAQCAECKHFQGWFVCAAFDGIPGEILMGYADHRKPYPGDHDVRFESVDDQESPLEFMERWRKQDQGNL